MLNVLEKQKQGVLNFINHIQDTSTRQEIHNGYMQLNATQQNQFLVQSVSLLERNLTRHEIAHHKSRDKNLHRLDDDAITNIIRINKLQAFLIEIQFTEVNDRIKAPIVKDPYTVRQNSYNQPQQYAPPQVWNANVDPKFTQKSNAELVLEKFLELTNTRSTKCMNQLRELIQNEQDQSLQTKLIAYGDSIVRDGGQPEEQVRKTVNDLYSHDASKQTNPLRSGLGDRKKLPLTLQQPSALNFELSDLNRAQAATNRLHNAGFNSHTAVTFYGQPIAPEPEQDGWFMKLCKSFVCCLTCGLCCNESAAETLEEEEKFEVDGRRFNVDNYGQEISNIQYTLDSGFVSKQPMQLGGQQLNEAFEELMR